MRFVGVDRHLIRVVQAFCVSTSTYPTKFNKSRESAVFSY